MTWYADIATQTRDDNDTGVTGAFVNVSKFQLHLPTCSCWVSSPHQLFPQLLQDCQTRRINRWQALQAASWILCFWMPGVVSIFGILAVAFSDQWSCLWMLMMQSSCLTRKEKALICRGRNVQKEGICYRETDTVAFQTILFRLANGAWFKGRIGTGSSSLDDPHKSASRTRTRHANLTNGNVFSPFSQDIQFGLSCRRIKHTCFVVKPKNCCSEHWKDQLYQGHNHLWDFVGLLISAMSFVAIFA